MIECISAAIGIFLIIFVCINGINVTINVNVEHKTPESPVMHHEDLFDAEGDFKEKDDAMKDFNSALKDIHDFMVDTEE